MLLIMFISYIYPVGTYHRWTHVTECVLCARIDEHISVNSVRRHTDKFVQDKLFHRGHEMQLLYKLKVTFSSLQSDVLIIELLDN